jgi:hypothetical protein
MRIIKWLGVATGALLILSCFFSWVVIESKNIVVTGVDTKGTNFGKPAYLHIFFIVLYIVFLLVNKLWGYRVNIFISALNLGWAFRNFILIPACEGGECPQKKTGIYLIIFTSIALLIIAFFGSNKTYTSSEEDETE